MTPRDVGRRLQALTVIAGLSVSTVLTLVVIPVVYDRIDAVLARARRRGAVAPDTAPLAADGELPT